LHSTKEEWNDVLFEFSQCPVAFVHPTTFDDEDDPVDVLPRDVEEIVNEIYPQRNKGDIQRKCKRARANSGCSLSKSWQTFAFDMTGIHRVVIIYS